MIRPSSILLGAGRDDDRWSPGFKKAASATLYGGMAVTQDNSDTTGKTIKPFAGQTALSATNPLPLGLVFESSVLFPVTNTTNPDGQAGYGYDNLNYARGGLYSVFHRPGNLVDVLDDGRNTVAVDRTVNGGGTSSQAASIPFIAADNWAMGDTVYATPEGLLTRVSTGTIGAAKIGIVRAVSGSGASAILAIELGIAAI